MKTKAVILGLGFGLVLAGVLLILPMPFRSVPYWIQHFEEAAFNRLTASLFPNPYSTARDLFFILMGLLHCFAWAMFGGLAFLSGAILISKAQKK
jgi:hypothetical protein